MPKAVIVSASKSAATFSIGQRLHRPEEFSAVMAAKRVLRGESFHLHFSRAEAQREARLGLMVPKRLARAASVRNAIKRQGREAFRLMAGEVAPCDLVLRLARPIKNVRARDKQQRLVWRIEIEGLLRRLPKASQ